MVNDKSSKTIVALATSPGRGSVGIVRLSGPLVPQLIPLLVGQSLKPRYAHFLDFLDENNQAIDKGIALYFKAPHSFTGEDVLELQGHGGHYIIDQLIKRACDLGAVLAEPGEFTLQAFLNNKIDLVQAEAIADLIEANSTQAARSALHSLQGVFSDSINILIEKIINLRIYVEAAIDFPDEELDLLNDGKVLQQLETLKDTLHFILQKAQVGKILASGLNIVIMGRPNAGKSSILNRLAGTEVAIVTDIPGTTRDVLKEKINIDGLLLNIIDTAGLRETTDAVESIGIQRALNEIKNADIILMVIDASLHKTIKNPKAFFPEWADYLTKKTPIIVIHNKIDKINAEINTENEENSDCHLIPLSAKTGQGFEKLFFTLKKIAGFTQVNESTFTARRRHLQALSEALKNVNTAIVVLQKYKAAELVAEELYCAQKALEEITGKFRSDELLGKIFSEFCIGK